MRIELEREEVLACIVILERWANPGGWAESALAKLLKVMGMKPKGEV